MGKKRSQKPFGRTVGRPKKKGTCRKCLCGVVLGCVILGMAATALLTTIRMKQHFDSNNLLLFSTTTDNVNNSSGSSSRTVISTDNDMLKISSNKESPLPNAKDVNVNLSIEALLQDSAASNIVKEKIFVLETLLDANVTTIDQETLQQLPPMSQVSNLYGVDPIIVGIPRTSDRAFFSNENLRFQDQCKVFREKVDPKDRLLGVAGMLNTGTNVLFFLLQQNCMLQPKHVFNGSLWQVPWGKHNPPMFRGTHFAPGQDKVNVTAVLPVVTVRDPFAWMVSMCKHPYIFVQVSRDVDKHCPSLVDSKTNQPLPVRIPKFNLTFDSMVGLWNDYYRGYYRDLPEQNDPRLLVRMEDLIFHPKQVTTQVCECAGGTIWPDRFNYQIDSSKSEGHYFKEKNGMIEAMIKYGSDTYRLNGLQPQDFTYAYHHCNPELMHQFGYYFPRSLQVGNQ